MIFILALIRYMFERWKRNISFIKKSTVYLSPTSTVVSIVFKTIWKKVATVGFDGKQITLSFVDISVEVPQKFRKQHTNLEANHVFYYIFVIVS